MRDVTPEVELIARPQIDWESINAYLDQVGGQAWGERVEGQDSPDGEDLLEFAGRMCYRSWEPGLNPNVSRVRTDSAQYLGNVIGSQHGSVLEHANFTFVLHNVSRVFTHELIRHRAGSAYSQESLRYVRLEDIPFWFPDWAREDPELMERSLALLDQMEQHQAWMAQHFGLDEEGTNFSHKKHMTSFMRRFAPEGLATGIVYTANLRTLRHVIEMRTAPGAEEEIRLVFNRVGEIMRAEAPAIFADYEVADGTWTPGTRKA
ncbi:FAD-dependent thymidylate synthase [Brevibacterium sp. 5221]|uniref:FAD-dependent thymidylate synthase n=1 Tax=Brevibacterium rongguiense TaxID=2695267 RepID=A0A6N9H3G7_9MICO|nr:MULTISPECIES: FAD-dependent thymidylate synthase [Brevibacterium]MYM18597.1 FAD-dependent thymidylate synthase [Brevibacterium rongguiense]WAL41378.1 FAD-dependent thymidylate synthase [Brevibacterium sp. BRM-1]